MHASIESPGVAETNTSAADCAAVAIRGANRVCLEANPRNIVLMYATGPSVAGIMITLTC